MDIRLYKVLIFQTLSSSSTRCNIRLFIPHEDAHANIHISKRFVILDTSIDSIGLIKGLHDFFAHHVPVSFLCFDELFKANAVTFGAKFADQHLSLVLLSEITRINRLLLLPSVHLALHSTNRIHVFVVVHVRIF